MRPRIPFVLVALVSTTLVACNQPSAEKAADFVFTNGKVYTVNDAQPWAEAVAVKGNELVYVGGAGGVDAFIGDGTEVVDLEGHLMLPGLASTHEHPLLLMAGSSGLVLEYTQDASKMLTSVREYVHASPDAPMFSFGGSYEGRVEIFRQDLDAIVSDRPFLMIAASGHAGWVNTAGLEAAGITRDTPDPIDSFQRESDGTPNGYIETSAATMWMMDALGVIRREAANANARSTLDALAAFGFTAVQDQGVFYQEDVLYPVIGELEERGKLNVRISASVAAQREVMIEGVLEKLPRFGELYNSDLFRVGTLKIHGDGAVDGWTAGLLEPYTDRPDTTGVLSFSAEAQRRLALAGAELGFDIHAHSIGDATVRQSLDAFQAVREAGFSDLRLTVGHTSLAHPDDIPRFVELDVTANTFATKNAVPDDTNATRLGPERYSRFQPMGTLLDAGVRLSMSADYPTAPVNPWEQISVAMARHMPGEGPDFLGSEDDKLTLEEAIYAYTMAPVHVMRWDHIIGSLDVGKRADLVVVDTDLFEASTDEIARARALLTMMDGRFTHRDGI